MSPKFWVNHTELHRYINKEILEIQARDTEIKWQRDIRDPRYRDPCRRSKIQRYRDTEIQRQRDIRDTEILEIQR